MNWGNKLLLTFIVFATGMLYLVYRTTQTRYDLVEKDYYKSELNYQQIIDGTNEANGLTAQVALTQNEKGIQLQFPDEMKERNIIGDILFYCAYDKNKDKKFKLQIDKNAAQLFSPGSVKPGNYIVKINWKDDHKNYYSEKTIKVMQ
jgi:hypothetical protein